MNPIIHEVGLRDGLQMEAQTIATAEKIDWCRLLFRSGVDIIQLGSFVHPKRVPQMADSDALFRRLKNEKPERVLLSGLVLNEKGLERGLACGVELVCMGVSASETHSRKNTGMSRAEALERIIAMAQTARVEGCQVQGSIQSAFGCGYEGEVPEAEVLRIIDRYLDAGLSRISVADTAGHADPVRVSSLFGKIRQRDHSCALSCHFHDTFGLGIANCVAAFSIGVTGFESSFGGLGGCPFTAVAGGNACTEDLVHMFQRMNLRPDIALDVLLELSRRVSRHLNRELPGAVYKTGPIADMRRS